MCSIGDYTTHLPSLQITWHLNNGGLKTKNGGFEDLKPWLPGECLLFLSFREGILEILKDFTLATI